jgi:NNP family nitrate/nitrite transporter-like MFS transporter
MAFHELAPTLGFVSAPLLAEGLLRLLSWRGVLAFMGSWSVLMGLIFLFFGRGGNHKGEAPQLSSMQSIMTQPFFWMMAAFFIVSIGASLGTYSMMPLFLVSERGMSREWANTLIGLSRATGFLTLFFSGWIIDRAGHQYAMVLFLITTGLFILLIGLFQNPGITSLLVILQASSAACTFPAGFTMVSIMFPQSSRSLAVSLVIMIGYLLGGGAIPLGMGYIAERFSFSWSFSLLGLLTLSMIPLLFLVRSGRRTDP